MAPYDGTKPQFEVGEELVPGHGSHFPEGRVPNNIYFPALVDTAGLGSGVVHGARWERRAGYIYVVEPTGPFEEDPNVTTKRFPGNITQSYRTRQSLRVVGA